MHNRIILYNIVIPSNVTEIGESAFAYCDNLKKVLIPDDSKLQRFMGDVFYNSSIRCFIITSQVIEIKTKTFRRCEQLQIIEINENSQLDSIGSFMFNCSEQVILMVPVNLINLDVY